MNEPDDVHPSYYGPDDLITRLRKTIQAHRAEWDTPFGSIIACLELLKLEMFCDNRDEDPDS